MPGNRQAEPVVHGDGYHEGYHQEGERGGVLQHVDRVGVVLEMPVVGAGEAVEEGEEQEHEGHA